MFTQTDQPNSEYEPPATRRHHVTSDQPEPVYEPSTSSEDPDPAMEAKNGNRIVNLDMMMQMMNIAFAEHREHRPICNDIEFKLYEEQKIGLGSRLKFVCDNCHFVTSAMETYEKCKDSRGAAPSGVKQHL